VGLGSAKAATIQTNMFARRFNSTRSPARSHLLVASAPDRATTTPRMTRSERPHLSRVGGPDMPRASGGSRRWRHGADPRPGRGRPRARVPLSRRNARTASTSSIDSATQTRRRVLYRRKVRIPPLWVTRADGKFREWRPHQSRRKLFLPPAPYDPRPASRGERQISQRLCCSCRVARGPRQGEQRHAG
jgi:hypothetical protein